MNTKTIELLSKPWIRPEKLPHFLRQIFRPSASHFKRIPVEGHVIRYDPEANLPLKKGGTTDIYFNLRLSRTFPLTTSQVADAFKTNINALGTLLWSGGGTSSIGALIEVPLGISHIAANVSVMANLPLVTIRDEEKEGRATKGKIIGHLAEGMRVIIMDDVITDGKSKLDALQICKDLGVEVVAVMVLVDRDDGWKETFANAGFGDVCVWPGFTLEAARPIITQLFAEQSQVSEDALAPSILV